MQNCRKLFTIAELLAKPNDFVSVTRRAGKHIYRIGIGDNTIFVNEHEIDKCKDQAESMLLLINKLYPEHLYEGERRRVS